MSHILFLLFPNFFSSHLLRIPCDLVCKRLGHVSEAQQGNAALRRVEDRESLFLDGCSVVKAAEGRAPAWVKVV
jgi:hypothetical protein